MSPKFCSLHMHEKPVILEHVPHIVDNPENPYERYICNGPYTKEKVIEYLGYQIYGGFRCVGCKFLGDLAWFDGIDKGHVFHCNARIVENKGLPDEYIVRHTPEFNSSDCAYYQKGLSLLVDNSDCKCRKEHQKEWYENRPWTITTPEKSTVFDGKTIHIIEDSKEDK